MRTVEEIDVELREVGNEVSVLRAARNAALHRADEARCRLVSAHSRIDTLIDERTQSMHAFLVERMIGE